MSDTPTTWAEIMRAWGWYGLARAEWIMYYTEPTP